MSIKFILLLFVVALAQVESIPISINPEDLPTMEEIKNIDMDKVRLELAKLLELIEGKLPEDFELPPLVRKNIKV